MKEDAVLAYEFGPGVQAVKPVFIKDRVMSSMELIAVAHTVLPHVAEESGPDVGHCCAISATYRAVAPSHVSSAVVDGTGRGVEVVAFDVLRVVVAVVVCWDTSR